MKAMSLRAVLSVVVVVSMLTTTMKLYALAPRSTFHGPPAASTDPAKVSQSYVGQEEMTQDEYRFVHAFLDNSRGRTKFYPWNQEIMLRICQLGKVGGIPKSRQSDQAARANLFRLVDNVQADPRTFIDAADREMLGEKMPLTIGLILGRSVDALTDTRSRVSEVKSEKIKQMEALHYTLIDLLTTGTGIVQTPRLIDGQFLDGRPVKMELRIVHMEGEGFPKEKTVSGKSVNSVRDVVTYDPETNTVRLHLTSGFLNNAGISDLGQALLLPLMEIFAGKTRDEAMQELGRYNEEVKPGVRIPVSDLLLRDIRTAGSEGKWNYLVQLLRRYRMPPGISEQDPLFPYYRKIQDKITWAFIDNPKSGGGQNALAEVFYKLRDLSLIQRYAKPDPRNPMNEQYEAANRASARLTTEASANLNAWSDAGTLDIRRGSGQKALREWTRKFWETASQINEKFYPIPGHVQRLKINAANREMIGRVELKLLVDEKKPVGTIHVKRPPFLSQGAGKIEVSIGAGPDGQIYQEDYARLMIMLWSEIGDVQGTFVLEGSMHKDGQTARAFKPMFDTSYIQYVLGELVRVDASLAEAFPTDLTSAVQPPARTTPYLVDLGPVLAPAQERPIAKPDEGKPMAMEMEMARKMRETGKKAKQYALGHWAEDSLEDPDEAVWILYAARNRNLLQSILSEPPEPLPKAGKGLRIAAAQALDLIERRVLRMEFQNQFQLESARLRLGGFTRKLRQVLMQWILTDGKSMPGLRPDFLEKLEKAIVEYPPRVEAEPFVRGSNVMVEVRENTLKVTVGISGDGAVWNKEDWIRLIVASYYFHSGEVSAPERFFSKISRPGGSPISRPQESALKEILDLEHRDPLYRSVLWDVLRQFHQTEYTDPLGAENPFFDRDKLINSAPADTDPDFIPELRKFLRVAHLLEISELEEYLKKIRSRPNFYSVITRDQFRLDITMIEIEGRYVEIDAAIQELLKDPYCTLQKVASLLYSFHMPMFSAGTMFEEACGNPRAGIPKLLQTIKDSLPEQRRKEEDALRERTLMGVWGRISGDPFVFEGGRMIPVPAARDQELTKHYLSVTDETQLKDAPMNWEDIRPWVPEPLATHLQNCRLLIWKGAPHLALFREEEDGNDTLVLTEGLWTFLRHDLSSLGMAITEQLGREQEKQSLSFLNGPYARDDIAFFRSLKNALNDQAWNQMNMEKAQQELTALERRYEEEMQKEKSLPVSEQGLSSILHDAKSSIDLLRLRIHQSADNKGDLRRAVEGKLQKWEGKMVDDLSIRLCKMGPDPYGFGGDLALALRQRGARDIQKPLTNRLRAVWSAHQAMRERLGQAKQSVWVSLEALIALKRAMGSLIPLSDLLDRMTELSKDVPLFITTPEGLHQASQDFPELFEKRWGALSNNIIPGVKTQTDFLDLLAQLPQDRMAEQTIVFDRMPSVGKAPEVRRISQAQFNLPRLVMEMRTEKLIKEGAISLSRNERRELETLFANLFSADPATRKATLTFWTGLKVLRLPNRTALRDAIVETLIAFPLEEELVAILVDQMRRKGLSLRYHNWIVYNLITTNSPKVLHAVLRALADPKVKAAIGLAGESLLSGQLLEELGFLASTQTSKIIKEPAQRAMIGVALKAIPRYWDDSIAPGLGEMALDRKNLLTNFQRIKIIRLLAKKGTLALSTEQTKKMIAHVLEIAVLELDLRTHYSTRNLLSDLIRTLDCGDFLLGSISEEGFRFWQSKVHLSRILEVSSFLMKEAARPKAVAHVGVLDRSDQTTTLSGSAA